jgi:hypothetical protein
MLHISRYTALLGCLTLLIVIAPMVPADWSAYGLEIAFNMVLLAGVFPAAWHSRFRWPFTLLTVVTFGLRWAEHVSSSIAVGVLSSTLSIVWVSCITAIIVATLFRARTVTIDIIIGAIVVYFLIVIGWSQLYLFIYNIEGNSFVGIKENKESISLVYFSLGCMSGMNFGDIVPRSDLTRSLAMLEAVFGMFFVAITVARLVGLNIVDESENRGRKMD